MPKKISTNSKALEARERKSDAKKVATERAVKDAEDRLWQDDDKNLAKKKLKKEEEERKRAELLRKKAENKELLEKEVASIRVAAKQSIQKVTQAQIAAETEKRNRAIESINAAAKAPVSIYVFLCASVLSVEFNFFFCVCAGTKSGGA